MRKNSLSAYSIATFVSAISVVALAASIPAAAQYEAKEIPSDDTATEGIAQSTEEQQAQMAGWPTEWQTAYELWPEDIRTYYWTLPPERQELFWQLSDDDKMTIVAMPAPDQDTAWQTIESRMATPPPEG